MGFWKEKTMDAMSTEEWESLCDGCAKCCLGKVVNPDDDTLVHTAIACRLLDTDTCRCTSYAERQHFIPDCIRLTPHKVRTLSWLPSTCAYRLVKEGKDLPPWHPLISGDKNSTHAAKQSVRGRVVSERDLDEPWVFPTRWPAPWSE